MKVLVCGSRYWDDIAAIRNELDKLPDDTIIIHGGAKGADNIAGEIAKLKKFKVKVFRAKWGFYGYSAGPRRNTKMIKENPDLVLAFTYDLSKSKGTADTVRKARTRDIPVRVIGEE